MNIKKTFTMDDVLKIQAKQLEEWREKLNKNCYIDLMEKIAIENRGVTDPYKVFRGSDMSNFIANWKPNKLTVRSWKVGDLLKHPNGQSLLIGFDGSDLIWLRETGFTYLSDQRLMLEQFSHNTGLDYKYFADEQVQRDFAAGLFTPYFEIL